MTLPTGTPAGPATGTPTPPALPTPPAPPAPLAAPPAPAPAAPAAGATPTPPAAGEPPLGPAGQSALQAERERVAELTRQLAAATAGQTDQQRTQTELAQLQADLATEKKERLRLAAATTYAIPAGYLHMLTATDEAGLKAQAESVASLITAATTAAGGTPPLPPPAPPAAPALPGQGTPPAAPATTSTLDAGAAAYQARFGKKT